MKILPQEEATIVRLARPDDGAAMADLLATLGYPASEAEVEERLARNAAVPDTCVFVVEHDGLLLGLASFHRIPLFHADGYVGRITSFVVEASHRKQGVGRLLATALEEFAVEHGCVRMEVVSGEHRPEAHEFYQRVGYQIDCRRFIKHTRKDPNQSIQPTRAYGPRG